MVLFPPCLNALDGIKRHIAALAMARQNAREELNRRLRERGAGPALDELVRVLGLKARPSALKGLMFPILMVDILWPPLFRSKTEYRTGKITATLN